MIADNGERHTDAIDQDIVARLVALSGTIGDPTQNNRITISVDVSRKFEVGVSPFYVTAVFEEASR